MVKAIKEVLKNRVYKIIFLLLIFIIFFTFVATPVFIIPGNDFVFQLSIYTYRDYVLLTTLSLLISIMFTFQIYIFRKVRKNKERLKNLGSGAVGGTSSIFATIFATAACSSCVAAVFGFLGYGAILFLLHYRWYIVFFAIGAILVSFYFAAKKVNNICKIC